MKSFRAYSFIAVYTCLIFSPNGTIVLADSKGEGDLSGLKLDSRKLGCNGGEVLLTHNRTLAPRRLVQASDFLTTLTRASRVYDSGITWCTYDRDVDPYVDMEFTSPVLITMMISSGSVFNQNRYYVTNFTLEYSPPNNSSMLNYYLSADDSVENGSVKYFEGSDFITLIQFERPFLTKRIRSRPVAWHDSDGSSIDFICQGVALYGCLDTNVTDVGPINGTATLMMVTDNQSLLIILPITSITIAILLMLLAVLIIYMLTAAYKRNHRTDSGYSHLDRSQQSIEMSSEGHITTTMDRYSCGTSRGPSVMKRVDNPIYERDTSKNISTSVNESGYEPINSLETKTCEEDLRYQEYSDGMQVDGHIFTSLGKVRKEDKNVVKLSYESVELKYENNCNALKDVQLNDTVSRDSMIDNTAYYRKSYVRDMLPTEGITGVVDQGENEQQYEEVVILESNSSYS